jgi:hypothetical protein
MRAMRSLLVWTVLVAVGAAAAWAVPVDPNAAKGKKVLFLINRIKLERSKAASPQDPAKVTMFTTQRANDDAIVKYLGSLGFGVTLGDEATPESAASGMDLILISESVDALDMAGKFRTTPVPLITFENDLTPSLGMTGMKNGVDTGTAETQRLLWVVNAPHPLAAGLPAGLGNVLDDEHVRMNWGHPGPGAIVIATLPSEEDKAAIFAYEKGATMHWEFCAPARRMGFFLYSDTFLHLRPEGLALFRAAVLWSVSRVG